MGIVKRFLLSLSERKTTQKRLEGEIVALKAELAALKEKKTCG